MSYAFGDEIVNLLIGQGLAEDNQLKLIDKCRNCGLECYEYLPQPCYISERTLGQLKGLNRTAEIMSIPETWPVREVWRPLLDPVSVVNKDVFLLLHERYPRMQFIPIFPKGYVV